MIRQYKQKQNPTVITKRIPLRLDSNRCSIHKKQISQPNQNLLRATRRILREKDVMLAPKKKKKNIYNSRGKTIEFCEKLQKKNLLMNNYKQNGQFFKMINDYRQSLQRSFRIKTKSKTNQDILTIKSSKIALEQKLRDEIQSCRQNIQKQSIKKYFNKNRRSINQNKLQKQKIRDCLDYEGGWNTLDQINQISYDLQ